MRSKISTAEQALLQAELQKAGEILPLIRVSRDGSLLALRKAILEIAPYAAKLASHELLQVKLLGENYANKEVHGESEDFNALGLVEALFVQMPPRLRPTEVEMATIGDEIRSTFHAEYKALTGEK